MKIDIDENALNKLQPKDRCIYLYSLLYPDKPLRDIAHDLRITVYKSRVILLSVKSVKKQTKIKQKIKQKSNTVEPVAIEDADEFSNKKQTENQTKIKQNYVKYTDGFLCDKWQNELYNNLIPYVETYGKEMIVEFCNYWNEPNKSKSDCRWHMEKTWSINGRLSLWSRRTKITQKTNMILTDNNESKYDNDKNIWET